MKTLLQSEPELKARREAKETPNLLSGYNFINSHNGIRQGNVHVLLATAGAGKSSLTRGIIRSITEKMKYGEVLVWLSEESVSEFQDEFAYCPLADKDRERIHIFSELDENISSPHALKTFVNEKIEHVQPKFLVIDNITTSALYMDLQASKQSEVAKWFKKITDHYNLGTLIVAHTGAEINDNINRIINMNDIRGSKSIVNLAQFFYIMQRFEVGSSYYPTLRITKHRSQTVSDRLFLLKYENKFRMITGDIKISFKEFKEAFNGRNKL